MEERKEDLFKSGNDDITEKAMGDSKKKEGLFTVLGKEIKYRIYDGTKPKYNYKLRTKIISYSVVAVLLITIVFAIIAAEREKKDIALVFALIFLAVTIGFMASVFIAQRRHLKKPKGGEIRREARVLGCTLNSSRTSLKSHGFVNTYRVKLSIDGEEYESYSHEILREGRSVTVLTADDPNKYCFIVPPADDGEETGN